MSSPGEIQFAMHCQCYGLAPETQYRFAEKRRWKFDFAWVEQKIAVEVEGGTWIYGRHNRASSIEADLEEYNQAALLGWRVLRFTTDMVKSGTAINMVLLAVGV